MTGMLLPHRQYLLILALLFGVWWIVLAIHPLHRNPWLPLDLTMPTSMPFLTGLGFAIDRCY